MDLFDAMNIVWQNWRIYIDGFCNVPKFSDRQVRAKSVDARQTGPEATVWSGSTVKILKFRTPENLL